MFQVRETCGWCNQLADFVFVFAAEFDPAQLVRRGQRQRGGSEIYVQAIQDEDPVHGYATSCCPLCRQPALFTFGTKRRYLENIIAGLGNDIPLWGGESLISIKRSLPETLKAKDHPAWPAKIRSMFADVQLMAAEKKSPAFVVSGCRTVLEQALKELKGEGRNNFERIDDLAGKGVITAPMKDWAHRVRKLGNDAIHDVEADPKEAEELVAFVLMFLEMTFTLPHTIQGAQSG